MAARLFQLFGPMDIVFFVKPRLQLHKHGYLFPVFRRFDQRCNNRGIAADAVKRLLDCQNVWIVGCRFDKAQHTVKAFIWVMHHAVSFTNCLKNVVIAIKICRRRNRYNRLKTKMVTTVNPCKLRQECEVKGTGLLINLLRLYIEHINQKVFQLTVALSVNFQTHRLAAFSFFNGFLYFFH